MSIFRSKAREAFAGISGAQAPGDHPFLDLLAEWLPKLLPLLLACLPMAQRNAAGLTATLKNPTRRQRRQLRRFVNDNIDDPRTGTMSADEIETGLVTMASACTETDSEAMISQGS